VNDELVSVRYIVDVDEAVELGAAGYGLHTVSEGGRTRPRLTTHKAGRSGGTPARLRVRLESHPGSQGNLVPPPQSDLAAEGSTARVRRNRIALVARFELEAARVRVRKPAVRLEAPVEWTAATVERRRL
jgi:hypothetical protein